MKSGVSPRAILSHETKEKSRIFLFSRYQDLINKNLDKQWKFTPCYLGVVGGSFSVRGVAANHNTQGVVA